MASPDHFWEGQDICSVFAPYVGEILLIVVEPGFASLHLMQFVLQLFNHVMLLVNVSELTIANFGTSCELIEMLFLRASFAEHFFARRLRRYSILVLSNRL